MVRSSLLSDYFKPIIFRGDSTSQGHLQTSKSRRLSPCRSDCGIRFPDGVSLAAPTITFGVAASARVIAKGGALCTGLYMTRCGCLQGARNLRRLSFVGFSLAGSGMRYRYGEQPFVVGLCRTCRICLVVTPRHGDACE